MLEGRKKINHILKWLAEVEHGYIHERNRHSLFVFFLSDIFNQLNKRTVGALLLHHAIYFSKPSGTQTK